MENKEKFECMDCGCYYWVEDRNNFTCPNCEDKTRIQLQEDEISLHSELLKHVKKEGTKEFFEILQQYIDNQIELEKHCNQ